MGRAIRRVIRFWELVFDVREDQGHHKIEGGNLPSWLKFRWDAQCSPIVRASSNNLSTDSSYTYRAPTEGRKQLRD